MIEPFIVAHSVADHWGRAAKECLDGLGDRRTGGNLGFLYATEGFGADLVSILTFLRETTGIECWVGGVAPGLCAQSLAFRTGPALAIMTGTLPPASFEPFTARAMSLPPRTGHGRTAAIVHGNPRQAAVPRLVGELSHRVRHLAGGLLSVTGAVAQVAGRFSQGFVSGLLMGPGIDLVVGVTQGCSPIGPEHVVTACDRDMIREIDGRPAIDVLREEAGDLIARDLRRAVGYIHVGLPAQDAGGYRVRPLLGVDSVRRHLIVGAQLAEGDRILLVRRDPSAAQTDLARMLADMRRDLDGRRVLGALYVTCIGRGSRMFGDDSAEAAMIREALDNVPLLGFFANGEFANGELYGYTGVLAVMVDGDAG